MKAAVDLAISTLLIAVQLTVASALIPEGTPGATAAEPPQCERCTGGAVTSEGEGFNARVTRSASEVVHGRSDPKRTGPARGRNEYERVEEQRAPTCDGSARGSDTLCLSATATCPAPEQIRYWIWRRVTRVVVAPPSEQVGPWVQAQGTFCLGPDDPSLSAIGRLIAQVDTEFRRLPLPEFTVRTDPAPQTLVNVPTAFSAGSGEPVTFTPTVLGARLTITARPVRWEWTFGDGATLITDRPGIPRRPDVAHLYRRSGLWTSSVRVMWTGTFTFEGSPEVRRISSPAYVQGPQTLVDVREARAELVSR